MKKHLESVSFIFLFSLLIIPFLYFSQGSEGGETPQIMAVFNSFVPGGNWNSNPTWGGSAPGFSHNDQINIVNSSTVTINGNINVSGSGSTSVRGHLVDPAGGTAYTFNSGTSSALDIFGVFTIEGAFAATNTVAVHVHDCGVMNTGSMSFTNNTTLVVDSCSTINITGNLTLSNSFSSTVDGSINVSGNVLMKNNSSVVGTGTITAQGSITISNSASLFDWTVSDCPDTPSPCVATMSNPGLLPIELIDFSANPQDRSILLKWITATEQNNSYFSIEKSIDAIHFSEMAEIPSLAENGNSIQSLHYSFTDSEPGSGPVYYRLKQTDFDGSYSYSKIISSALQEDELFRVFPNPTHGPIHFQSRLAVAENSPAQVTIYTLYGVEVFKKNYFTNNLILESDIELTPGRYIVSYKVKDKVITKPLIVEN